MKSILWTLFLIVSFLLGKNLVAQGSPTVVDVGTFGAQPDDGQDDLLAIRNAIASMVKSGGASYILRFHTGIYDLNPKAVLGQPGANNTTIFRMVADYQTYFFLEIEGNGATLKCHGFDPFDPVDNSWYSLFYFNGIRDLQIHGLTVSMSRVPYTMGQCNKVTYSSIVGARSFEVNVDPLIFGANSIANSTVHMLLHYPSPFYPNGFRFFYVQDSNPIPFAQVSATTTSNQYRITGTDLSNTGRPGWQLMNDIPQFPSYGKIQVGDYVLIDHQFGGYIVFDIAGCEGVDVHDTTIHHWAGMGIGIHYSSNINISGFNVIPDPNTPKPELTPMSTTADAIHIRESWGILSVSDCTLDGMGDDALNIYVPMSLVYHGAVPNGTKPCLDYTNGELEIDPPCHGVCLFKVGDLFEFLDKEGRPLGPPNPVQSFPPSICGGGIRIKFQNPLPYNPNRPIHYIYDASQFPTSIDISNVSVFGNRGGGFMLHRNTTVSNCTVDSSTSAAILVGPSIGFWNEGPAGGDVLIQSSQFLGTANGEGFGTPEEGAISIATAWYKDIGNGNYQWTYGPQGGVGHVTIDDCWFDLNGGSNVCARSADWVTIKNCGFGSTSMHYSLQPSGESQSAAKALIWFNQTGKADILYNTLLLPEASWQNPDGWWQTSKPNPYNKVGNNF